MKVFSGNKTEAVLFVNGMPKLLKLGSVLTMTITREMSGVYSVTSVIEELSEDTGLGKDQTSSDLPMSILQLPTQAG